MKYAVTVCAFDQTVGANPLWHTCFFISQMDVEKKLLEVIDAWGFYGVPSTGDKKSWIERLKNAIALDIDLQGNHGMLIHEEIRYMDKGHGLHGRTFEITQGQFNLLRQKCVQFIEDQDAAIRDAAIGLLNPQSDSSRKIRFYNAEPYSRQIYQMELLRANMRKKEPRLKPFDIHCSLSLQGLSLEQSHTCKTMALSILSCVLTKEQLEPFKGTTFPRLIPGMEPVLLHSRGPVRTHTKPSGEVVSYRNRKDDGVNLYWSFPPQYIDALSEDTINLCTVEKEYCQEAKSVISKLQALEWLFRDAVLPEQYDQCKEVLIQQLIKYYSAFALIEPKKEIEKISGWNGYLGSLFSVEPRTQDQQKMKKNIEQAKILFNSLYMATVDNWLIDENCPWEFESGEKGYSYYNPLEALASCLSVKDKKNLCRIIGRNYCVDELVPSSKISL